MTKKYIPTSCMFARTFFCSSQLLLLYVVLDENNSKVFFFFSPPEVLCADKQKECVWPQLIVFARPCLQRRVIDHRAHFFGCDVKFPHTFWIKFGKFFSILFVDNRYKIMSGINWGENAGHVLN